MKYDLEVLNAGRAPTPPLISEDFLFRTCSPFSMQDGVKEVAGYIEDYLEWAGEASLSDIVEEVDVPNPVVLMGVGYLVSENKVDYADEEGYQISLI
jgi:hypothetical protein